tara:strand:- start:584 stop:1468 length:885 start_codon:yes stop_codon:yes gene_type:complete
LTFLKRPNGKPVDLRNLYKGMTCFISGGGPSLNNLDLKKLEQSRMMVIGINNAWSKVPVDIMICQDPPGRFLGWGWMNPRIMKLCPEGRRNDFIRTKNKHGEFVEVPLTPRETPNTYLFKRNLELHQRSFLDHRSINWGCDKKCPVKYRDRNTFLSTLQLAHYFGFSRVYLIGVDFKFPVSESPYAFTQNKETKAQSRNNEKSFPKMINQITLVKPLLEKAGMEIFNCNKDSNLQCFEYVSFEEAVESAKLWPKEETDWYYNWENDPKEKYKLELINGSILTTIKRVEKKKDET